MAESYAPDAAKEQELREKIRAGSQELDDYLDLADLLRAGGRTHEVVPQYREALNLPLTNLQRAEVSTELGWVLYDPLCEEAEARTLAENAIHLLAEEPESPEVLFARASSHGLLAHSVWRTDESTGAEAARQALASYDRGIAESSSTEQIAQAYYDSARLQNLLGKHEVAIPLFGKALECGLHDLDRLYCLITLSNSLRRANHLAEAERVLNEALQHVEADKGALPRIYFERGLILRSTGRPAEAWRSFQEALEALKSDPALSEDEHFLTEASWNLGELSYEAGNYEKAAASFRAVLSIHPEDDSTQRDALLWLGHCYIGTRNYGKARDCYEEVLASRHATEAQLASARDGMAALPPLPKQRLH